MSYVVRLGELENGGVNYAMWLETPHSQPARTLQSVERFGTWPVATGVQQGTVTDLLHIVIRPEQPKNEALDAPLRSALLQTLDTDVAAVPLVIADNDGSRERYRYYVTLGLDEQEDEVAGLHWVATLVTADDAKWRSLEVQTVVWDAFESGAQQVVTNGGDAPALPTYEVRPTADRTAGWDQRMFVAFDPNTRLPSVDEVPFDIANGNWDTAALVTAGDITSADEIGVIVDGREVRRWITGYNTMATKVWINLPYRGSLETRLKQAIGPADVMTELEVARGANDIRLFPPQGMLLVDEEVFTYTGKDVVRGRFLGVTGAAKDTAADSHADFALIHWLEHEIWIVYGGKTAEENFYDDAPEGESLLYDDRKPTIDLPTSSNKRWVFLRWPSDGDASESAEYRFPKWRSFATSLGIAGFTDLVPPEEWDAHPFYRELYLQRLPSDSETAGVGGTSDDWRSYWFVNLPGYWVTALEAGVRATRYDGGDFIAFIHTSLESSEALMELNRPADLNATIYQILNWTGSIDPERIYFAQQGTASMRVTLDTLNVDFSAFAYDGPQFMRTEPQDNYSLEATLTNLTTGEALAIQTELAWENDLGLRIDTGTKKVTLLSDRSNQYQAVTRDAHRQEMLSLVPGDNTLQIEEEGLQGMQVVITFEERTYA